MFGLRWAQKTKPCLWHLELFSARLPVKVFKTLNGRQSYILSKFRSPLNGKERIKLDIISIHQRKVKIALPCFIIMHQSIPAAPNTSPPAFAHLVSPGGGHLQILRCPGAGHLPTPGPFLSFWHARGSLSENNYTEDFTGKESRLAHLSRTGKIEEVCKGMFLILCMHFFIAYRARIT